jgi:UDP-glucose 4-epimerase
LFISLEYGAYAPTGGSHKNSVVAKFFKDILAGGQITIDGDGQQTRDFIYVDDLCRAILLALWNRRAGDVSGAVLEYSTGLALEGKVSGKVFQIATGVETSIIELAEMVQEVVGRHVGVQHGPPRQGDIRKNYSVI